MSILKRPGWNNYEVLQEGRLHNDKLKERISKMFDRLSLGYSPNHVVDKISSIIRHEKGDKMDISKVSDEYIMSIANSDAVTRGKFTPELRSSYVSTHQSTNAVDPTYSEPEENSPVSMNFTASSTEPNVPTAIPSVSFQEDSEEPRGARERRLERERLERERKARRDKEKEEEDAEEEEDEWDSYEKGLSKEEAAYMSKEYGQEDAEEVDTCGCEKKKMVFNPEIAKNNIKRVNSPDKNTIKKESVKLSPTAVNKLLKENFIKNKQHQFKFEEKYRVY